MPCSAGCNHDPSDPDHVLPGEGPGSDMLTSRIDIDNVIALNAEDEAQVKAIFKPWDERNNEGKVLLRLVRTASGHAILTCHVVSEKRCGVRYRSYLVSLPSDARALDSEQIIVRIPFTGSVKLRSIFVKGARGDECPTQMKVFSNIPDIDFDAAESEKPTQIIDLVEARDAVEYPVPAARYPSVNVITLFFSKNAGGEQTQIYYIGFRGEFSKRADKPGQIVYESQANPADHMKLPGMGVGMHSHLGS